MMLLMTDGAPHMLQLPPHHLPQLSLELLRLLLMLEHRSSHNVEKFCDECWALRNDCTTRRRYLEMELLLRRWHRLRYQFRLLPWLPHLLKLLLLLTAGTPHLLQLRLPHLLQLFRGLQRQMPLLEHRNSRTTKNCRFEC
jgi:hypothetical protein